MAAVFCLKIIILMALLFADGQSARLYTEEDPVVILTSDTLKPSVFNSSTAWIVQFYSSWCGHCIQYSPTWKALADDVKDWAKVIRIGVVDCAHEKNFDICKEFGIHFYPTFRYFKAHDTTNDFGKTYQGAGRDLQTVRQLIVNFLQNHTRQDLPVSCPPLDPARAENILSLIGKKTEHYTAVIVEERDSYVGREVILDLMLYEGLTVKRALSSDKLLMEKLGISSVPSVYLFHRNGTHSVMNVQKRLRFFFSSFLKLLPGVHRRQFTSSLQRPQPGSNRQGNQVEWKDFKKSMVYMADLESGLHYLLRVELATHKTLEGEELKTFKDLVTVVAKLFPGRQSVVKLLETLLEWLVSLPLKKIPYDAILDLVNNKMRISGLYLSEQVQWVGCQGSSVALRGYPCSLWTLFHVLTVQAANRPDILANTGFEDDPLAVLQTMRRYIGTFFGCQECGKHFEEMAQESLNQVKSVDEAVLWLWRKHNQVNTRLSGSMSEDPLFPKIQWPAPDLCPTCHEEQEGLHVWNEQMVLAFLKQHYGASNISPKYTSSSQAEPGPPALDKLKAVTKSDSKIHLNQNIKPSERVPKHLKRIDTDGEKGTGVQRETRPGMTFLGLGFSSVDMSLCVLLYALSCMFLMVMFFIFHVRSKRWKARSIRPYI
ncbi:sulfhydryl oxidase 2-like [Myxocyprinus asiaticus]|uniref:sulfhydryl oxidase 2-like n=1 Tax=Myxocyprinus asiaticus TaxID=70543 RepID=UPI002221F4F6|nr:sulfhydryl oxidase 2-like [Myxocyprinus asiaticus]XP_051552597.1 sulfhydryl oxidase 2-like [Myxocyprinus asiaticus]